MTYRGAALAILAMVLGAGTAHGQEPSSGDLAAAEALFAEGKRLSDAGSFADACARFEASMSLVPRLGVQLNLAYCYEHIEKTASAWLTFGQAAALARRIGDTRETLAWESQAKLVPRLMRLRVSVAHAGAEGFAVTRDGMRIAPSVYGVEVPVDPGVHHIEATAPEHLPWSTQVIVSREGDVVTVEVPELERMPPPPGAPLVAPATPDAREERRRPTRLIWISAGVGVVAIGVGATFGIAARSLWNEARPDCDPSNNCTDAADALIQRSRRDGMISTVAFGMAGVAFATGLVLYLRGSRGKAHTSMHLVPAVTSSAVGAALAGAL